MNTSRSNRSGTNSPVSARSTTDFGEDRKSHASKSYRSSARNDDRSTSPFDRSSANRSRDDQRFPSPHQSPRSSFQRRSEDRKTSSPPLMRSSASNQRIPALDLVDNDRPMSPKLNPRASLLRRTDEGRDSPTSVSRGIPLSQRSSAAKSNNDPREISDFGDHRRSHLSKSPHASEKNNDQASTATLPRTPTTNPRVSRTKEIDHERPVSPSFNNGLSSKRLTDDPYSSRTSVRSSSATDRKPVSPLNSSRISNSGRKDDIIPKTPPKTFTPQDIMFHRAAFERCLTSPEQKVIRSREKFNLALSYAGCDLPKSRIDELWNQQNQEITLTVFQRLLQEEKPIDARALEEAFEIFYKDLKGNAKSIDFNRFRTDITEKGDRFTAEEFESVRRLLGTKEGKIDIKQLTEKIIDNRHDCRQEILMEKKEQAKEDQEDFLSSLHKPKPNHRGEKTNKVHVFIEPMPKKLEITEDTRRVLRKGAFFCEHFDSPSPAKTFYYSIGYAFDLKRPTPMWIVLEPKISGTYHKDKSFEQIDVRLLLFEILANSKRKLIMMSTNRSKNKSYIYVDRLARGSYEVLPLTFGGVLQPRSRVMNDRPPTKQLREFKRGRPPTMTSDYRKVLEFIFDLFDLDGNEQLDRNEYNLLTKRMTSQELTDDDWTNIQENFQLDKEQNISKSKYLEMNTFEVENSETKDEDLWNGVKSVGFNGDLALDMMCPFDLSFHFNSMDFHVQPTDFVEMTEVKKPLLKFLTEKSERLRLNIPSVECVHYQDACGSILFVENKSETNHSLKIQASNIKNSALTLSFAGRKPPVISVRQNSSEIIWFAHSLDNGRPMEIEATIHPDD